MLIVDVNMPQMDGVTFLKALRRQPAPLSSIPVLVTSSEAGAHDAAAARAAGANLYQIKPLTEHMLTRYAMAFCGQSR